jgi:VanZ family protein
MNSTKKLDLGLQITGCLFVAVIVVLSLVPGDYRPHLQGATNELEHVLAYAGTAGAFALVKRGFRRITIIVVSLMTMGALLELAQLMVPGRNASFRDVIADALGALIGVGLAVVSRHICSR